MTPKKARRNQRSAGRPPRPEADEPEASPAAAPEGDLYSVALRLESDPAAGGPHPDAITAALRLEPTATLEAGADPLGTGDAWERHLWMLSVDGAPGEAIEDLVGELAAAMTLAACDPATWRGVADRCDAYLWVGVFRAGEEARAALSWPVVEFAHRLRLPVHVAILPEDRDAAAHDHDHDGEA